MADTGKENKSSISKISFLGHEVEFTSGREKTVIEFGHGGGAILFGRLTKSYLHDGDFNYLGIDHNPSAVSMIKIPLSGNESWAQTINENIYKDSAEPSLQIANELWIRNFPTINNQNEKWHAISKLAFDITKSEGQVVFFDDDSLYQEKDKEMIKAKFETAGFEVKEFDPNSENHPLVSQERNMPGFDGYSRQALGFFAIKP